MANSSAALRFLSTSICEISSSLAELDVYQSASVFHFAQTSTYREQILNITWG
jgi:hypothetical protein